MKKLIPFFAAALCGLFASCAMADVRPVPPPRMVADVDPVELGEIEVLSTQIFIMGFKPHVLTLSYVPRSDDVLVAFRDGSRKGRVYFSRPAREQFLAGFKRYEAMYEAKELVDSKKTLDVFGRFPAIHEWGGMTSYEARGTTSLKFGYQFRDKAPWFTLIVDVTSNDLYDASLGLTLEKSSPKTFFFNRAKAAELAAILDQGALDALVQSPAFLEALPGEVEKDSDY